MQAEAQEQEFDETTSVELDDDSDEVIEAASDDEETRTNGGRLPKPKKCARLICFVV